MSSSFATAEDRRATTCRWSQMRANSHQFPSSRRSVCRYRDDTDIEQQFQETKAESPLLSSESYSPTGSSNRQYSSTKRFKSFANNKYHKRLPNEPKSASLPDLLEHFQKAQNLGFIGDGYYWPEASSKIKKEVKSLRGDELLDTLRKWWPNANLEKVQAKFEPNLLPSFLAAVMEKWDRMEELFEKDTKKREEDEEPEGNSDEEGSDVDGKKQKQRLFKWRGAM